MNWLYVAGADIAIGHVLAWITRQLGLPIFLALVIYFVCGVAIGRYFGKVERLAKKQERERYGR